MTTTTDNGLSAIADKINLHLANGGRVYVGTYLHVTHYSRAHVGWFTIGKDGNLYVQHGRGKNCLSCAGRLLVAVRFS